MNNANGSVFKYPDNVDTDVIIPARHLNTQDAKELAAHCMEDIDKDFIHNVKDGDIMVGGWNFGCGSSREHAPLAIKTAGISVVIAKSFARIFYRNSINIGLPIMECPEAVDAIGAGDTVSVNFDTGVITDETTGKTFQAEPFPPFIQDHRRRRSDEVADEKIKRHCLFAGRKVYQRRNTIGEAVKRRNEKKAFSEAASFFPFRLLRWGLKGASSPFLVGPARRNRWWFSGSLLPAKENIA